jgi:histidine triad (HIT) family protein
MCLFCQIANHEQQSDIVYEDDKVIVIRDINPKAKIHLLIISKEHIVSANELEENHKDLLIHMFLTAKKLARENSLKGHKLLFNVGREGGQLIDHLHLHLMGGGERHE